VINIGLVGFGRLAQAYYTPALRTFPTIAVVAIADPLHASRMAASKSFQRAMICHDYEDFSNWPVDALLVASPPSTHLAILNAALRRRIPIFIEKPVLLGGELKYLQTSRETCRLVMPDFNRRFWPAYRKLREICEAGRLGKIRRAEFILNVNVLPWLSVTSHRVEKGEGGALYDLGSSQLDLIQYVLGHKIIRLSASAQSIRRSNDHVRIDAQLESGLTVSCELSYAANNRERIIIFGEASARIEDPNCAVHVETHPSWKDALWGWGEDLISLGSKTLIRERSMLRYTIRFCLAEFFGALSERRPFSPDFTDALENDLCLEAAQLSIEQRKTVEVRSAGNHRHG
jgi:predicted dehydrogenase